MEPILFVVHCPTCGAKLAIHDRLLLGQLIACLKCSGMILVEDPASSARWLESMADTAPIGSVERTAAADNGTFQRGDESSGFSQRTEILLPESLPDASTLSRPLAPENLVLSDSADTLPEQLGEIGAPCARSATESIGLDDLANLGNIDNIPMPPVVISAAATSQPPRQTELFPQSVPIIENTIPDAAKSDFDDDDFDDDASDETPDAEESDDFEETAPIWLSPFFLAGLGLTAILLLTCTLFIVFRPNSEKSPEKSPVPAAIIPQTSETAQTNEPAESAVPETGIEPSETVLEPAEADEPLAALFAESPAEPPSESSAELPAEPPVGGENPQDAMESAAAQEPVTVASTLDVGLAEPLDIARRLAIPVRSIQFSDKTLVDVAAMLTGLTGVPILPDFGAIDHFPAFSARRIGLSLESTTAGDILGEAARQFDLAVRTEPDQILLVPTAAEPVETVFELSDLISRTADTAAVSVPEAFAARALSSALTPGQIAEVTADLFELKNLSAETNRPEENVPEENTAEENQPVPPQGSAAGGSSGTVSVEGTTLVVCASGKTVYDVQRFLEQLRSLRRLELQSPLTPEELIPETLGFEQLSEPMTLGFLEPVTLREALAVFGSATGRRFLLDEAALRAAGLSPETRTGFRTDSLPAERVLTELLAGYGLTWTAPAVDLIFVTTKEAAGRISTVEIYLYAPPEGDNTDTAQGRNAAVVRAIRTAGGVFWADPVSGCLFVRAPILTQRLLRQRFSGTAGELTESTNVNLMPTIKPSEPTKPTEPNEPGQPPNQDAMEPVPKEGG